MDHVSLPPEETTINPCRNDGEDGIENVLRLFPSVRTEGRRIDFDSLRALLGDSVDIGRERYSITWPGKADSFRAIQTPSIATLIPAPTESVKFDAAENLIIEGDNLEALKLMQKAYTGKVKVIYIDPPYNTGHDFIYPDDFADPLASYLALTGQVDEAGKRLSTNTDTDGRYHSKWLSMMYPRLYLARNLLCENGVIFVSIDDNEVANLRRICDEIFGEENFVSTFVWNSATAGGIRPKHVSQCHEYALMYARSKDTLDKLSAPLSQEAVDQYGKEDEVGPYREKDFAWRNDSGNPNQRYGITGPDGNELFPAPGYQYRFVRQTFNAAQAEGLAVFKETGTSPLVLADGARAKYNIYIKKYLGAGEGAPSSMLPKSLVGLSSRGTEDFKELFGGDVIFSNPKSTDLLRYLIGVGLCGARDGIVLDFFAGSGTTAQAVLELNANDGGGRRFILVQLPEPTERQDYATIAEITKERVRRAIKKLGADEGFRVFKLAPSNFTAWDTALPHDPGALARQLELHVNHVRPERNDDDILFEIILKSGYALTIDIERRSLAGSHVYAVAKGELIVCLEHRLTLALLRAIAEERPTRVICLDEGFDGEDQLKTNAVQICRAKGVLSFKTI